MDEREMLVQMLRNLAFDDLEHAANAADLLTESVWMGQHDNRVRAEAWDEGLRAGMVADHNQPWWTKSPYRVTS